jgi:hypothetical protein
MKTTLKKFILFTLFLLLIFSVKSQNIVKYRTTINGSDLDFLPSHVTGDYGRRVYTTEPWHKGIDFSIISSVDGMETWATRYFQLFPVLFKA